MRQSVPVHAWEDSIEDDVGLFPVRLQEMLDAFSSNQTISFKELLRVFCGGSLVISFKELLQVFCGGRLVQQCTFCDATITVQAVDQGVKGFSLASPDTNVQ